MTEIYRQRIELLLSQCVSALEDSINSGKIDESELGAATGAIDGIIIGNGLCKEAIDQITAVDPHAREKIERGINLLLRGLAACGGLVISSKTARKHVKTLELSDLTQPAREATAAKLQKRDEVLIRELGSLIETGLKGEKLRDALHAIFAREGIAGKQAKPGLRIVQVWSQEYRSEGKWRPNVKS